MFEWETLLPIQIRISLLGSPRNSRTLGSSLFPDAFSANLLATISICLTIVAVSHPLLGGLPLIRLSVRWLTSLFARWRILFRSRQLGKRPVGWILEKVLGPDVRSFLSEEEELDQIPQM